MDVKLIVYRGTTGGLYRHDIGAYLNALNPRVDGVVCVSKAVENHVKKQVFGEGKKIVTIQKGHNGKHGMIKLHLQIWKSLEQTGNFNVAFCSECKREHKGLIYVIKAAYKLADIKDLHILLIGKDISKNHIS